ncbi:MAG: hypothetical protein ABSE06_10015 [Anaerolineaceae bacterium]
MVFEINSSKYLLIGAFSEGLFVDLGEELSQSFKNLDAAVEVFLGPGHAGEGWRQPWSLAGQQASKPARRTLIVSYRLLTLKIVQYDLVSIKYDKKDIHCDIIYKLHTCIENIMKTPIRLTILVFTFVVLVACLTATPPATYIAPSTVPPPTPTPSNAITSTPPAPLVPRQATQPHGITAVNNLEPSKPKGSFFDGILFDDRTYTNPNIAGLTFRTSWADIEPTKGDFIWAKLDTVFDNAERNSKWVELVLIPGFGTPAWALQGVTTSTFSVIYGPGKGENLVMPLPWDQTYLNRWFAFLKAVSARYHNRPSFIKIAADGPTSITGEMTLPNAPADLCTWVQFGYTSDRIIGAWKEVFANYAQIFPRQYFSLALYPPLPIVSKTKCENGNPIGVDHSESQRVSAVIIGLGVDNYPKQFVLQDNGLTSTAGGAYNVVKSYGGKVVIGFQLATSAMLSPAYMGDPDGVTALRNSLQKGVDANVQFLEVYESDVLSPATQNVLGTFASALARKAH